MPWIFPSFSSPRVHSPQARTNVSVYDPVFGAHDRQLLAERHLTVLPENSVRLPSPLSRRPDSLLFAAVLGTRRGRGWLCRGLSLLTLRPQEARCELRSPTLVFMPHCELDLYENLLRANWTSSRLPNVLLVANALSDYAERCVRAPRALMPLVPRPLSLALLPRGLPALRRPRPSACARASVPLRSRADSRARARGALAAPLPTASPRARSPRSTRASRASVRTPSACLPRVRPIARSRSRTPLPVPVPAPGPAAAGATHHSCPRASRGAPAAWARAITGKPNARSIRCPPRSSPPPSLAAHAHRPAGTGHPPGTHRSAAPEDPGAHAVRRAPDRVRQHRGPVRAARRPRRARRRLVGAPRTSRPRTTSSAGAVQRVRGGVTESGARAGQP